MGQLTTHVLDTSAGRPGGGRHALRRVRIFPRRDHRTLAAVPRPAPARRRAVRARRRRRAAGRKGTPWLSRSCSFPT